MSVTARGASLRRLFVLGVVTALAVSCSRAEQASTPPASAGSSVATAPRAATTGTMATMGTTAAPASSGAPVTTTASVVIGPSTPAPPISVTTSGRPPDTLAGADTAEKQSPTPPIGATVLRAVRVAHHEGFDRVVFEFDEGGPGYRVRYEDPPVLQDPSGEPIAVAGATALRVTMKPAVATYPSTDRAPYAGAARVAGAGATAVTEVVQYADFEAVLSWAIGLDRRRAFTVTTLTGPSRVVVDIQTD